MSTQKLVTAIVAGVIVFAWGMISWMVLPWHKNTINSFKNEPVVVQGLKLSAPESGVYSYPAMDDKDHTKRPLIFMAISHKPAKNMAICMLIGLIIQTLGALVLTCIVSKANIQEFGGRLALIIKIVFFATIVCHLPYWHWWGIPSGYTLLAFLDLLIAWGIAGAWIAKRTT